MTLVSTQSFGLGAPGGGPRILRSLFADAPAPVVSVCTNPERPPSAEGIAERHLPLRPQFGRLEGTRPGDWLAPVEWRYGNTFGRRLEKVCVETSASALHAVPHLTDFWQTFAVAKRLDLPFLLTVHDDPRYVLSGRPDVALVVRRLGSAWRAAHARFVISEAMGRHYCAEFGTRPYAVITDGLSHDRIADRPKEVNGYRGYFAGLFHRSYIDGVGSFAAGLGELRAATDLPASLVLRCGALPGEMAERMAPGVPVDVREFGPESVVAEDMQEADFLYLPLPFNRAHEHFVRLSLSTKLVTYLGAGLPIVYHGPRDSAACRLLEQHDAAITIDATDPRLIADELVQGMQRAEEISANALTLARRVFTVEDQRRRFWSAVPV